LSAVSGACPLRVPAAAARAGRLVVAWKIRRVVGYCSSFAHPDPGTFPLPAFPRTHFFSLHPRPRTRPIPPHAVAIHKAPAVENFAWLPVGAASAKTGRGSVPLVSAGFHDDDELYHKAPRTRLGRRRSGDAVCQRASRLRFSSASLWRRAALRSGGVGLHQPTSHKHHDLLFGRRRVVLPPCDEMEGGGGGGALVGGGSCGGRVV
jgi:hypothetical protein